jgi:SAM-dependent methyltransferase
MHTRKLYDAPRYYEIAFSFRDYEREVALLVDLHDRLGQGELRSVLEIASGPASHLKALHRRGIAYTGLDLSSEMIDYASRRASELGARARFVQQDFCRFELDEHVDLAFVLLGSLMLPDQAALVSHFDSVARCLGPGGLYLLDWCVKFSWPEEEMEPWEMTDLDGLREVNRPSVVVRRV